MKQLLSIVVLSVLFVTGHAVTVEKTANLNVYYPEYSKIDLVDIFRPGSTLVRLRRVHSDEGGTFLFFD